MANDTTAMTTTETIGMVQWTDGLGNTGYYGGWPYVTPWVPYTAPTITYTQWPMWCSGDTHVWGCEHATKCKCGKATREPEVCPHCLKSHK